MRARPTERAGRRCRRCTTRRMRTARRRRARCATAKSQKLFFPSTRTRRRPKIRGASARVRKIRTRRRQKSAPLRSARPTPPPTTRWSARWRTWRGFCAPKKARRRRDRSRRRRRRKKRLARARVPDGPILAPAQEARSRRSRLGNTFPRRRTSPRAVTLKPRLPCGCGSGRTGDWRRRSTRSSAPRTSRRRPAFRETKKSRAFRTSACPRWRSPRRTRGEARCVWVTRRDEPTLSN
mmetsp:Transcript_12678/g.53126  ORF Transcript_12678/g.53126 Transcript_12678/m.53126 type:complete len:237 (+) Transcript_12678:486-1196(+)